MAALCLWSNLCGIYPIGTRMHKSHWEFCLVLCLRWMNANAWRTKPVQLRLISILLRKCEVEWLLIDEVDDMLWHVILERCMFVLWHVVLLDVGSSLARSHVSRCMSQSSTCHRARTSFQISMAAADTWDATWDTWWIAVLLPWTEDLVLEPPKARILPQG